MPYDGVHMLKGLVATCVVLLGCGGGLQPHFGFAEAGAEEQGTGGGDNRPGTTVEPRRHGKLPIAILGLEVYDNGAGVDRETVRAGLELTSVLRDRAKAGTGPYVLAPGGEKELGEEKMLSNCMSEAPTCMSAIGAELGAEMLMYGKIEKATQSGEGVYKVSIKLLSVTRKQLTSSTVETLPVNHATGVRAQMYAKTWYAKLAGAGSSGTLVIRANLDRGTVLVDDEVKGTLSSGTLTLTSLPEGVHALAIEATREYQRYEAQVTVRAGETTTQNVTMVELPRR
jgi:hypothetical protein